MTIVVLDGERLNPGDNPWDEIAEFGDLTVYDRTVSEDVYSRSEEADILLTNKTPLTKEVLNNLPKLKLICVLATGYNVIDSITARENGVDVANVPVYGTNCVCQYVFALLLELCHHVGQHSRFVINGDWARSVHWSYWDTPLIELFDKTIAVIGFGRIGIRVGELAHAFGMKVLAVDPFSDYLPGYKPFSYVALEEAYKEADVISLNCSLSKSNEGMIDEVALSQIKESAFIINASRGQLINEEDLSTALNTGRIAGAAVDVVSTEPIKPDNPLLTAKNCIITPHIAWATLEARQRIMKTTYNNIASFLKGVPENVVN